MATIDKQLKDHLVRFLENIVNNRRLYSGSGTELEYLYFALKPKNRKKDTV